MDAAPQPPALIVDGRRLDGRTAQERRAALLHSAAIGSAHGSASVRLGRSSAIAGVRAEVAELPGETMSDSVLNRVVATVELPPLCSAAFRDRHAAAGVTTFLASALTDVLNSPHVLDTAQLQVQEGESSWTLHVHVVCLNYDGNAFDLCLLAALAALEDTRLPALGEDPAEVGAQRLVELPAGTPGAVSDALRLALMSRPLPVTFAQLPGDIWVMDPTVGEESSGASVSLCLVGGKWLVYHQGGGTNAERLTGELMPLARSAIPDLEALLGSAGASAEGNLAG